MAFAGCKKDKVSPYEVDMQLDRVDTFHTSDIHVESDGSNTMIIATMPNKGTLSLHLMNYEYGKGDFQIDPTTLYIHTPYAQAEWVNGNQNYIAQTGSIIISNVTSSELQGSFTFDLAGGLNGTFTVPHP